MFGEQLSSRLRKRKPRASGMINVLLRRMVTSRVMSWHTPDNTGRSVGLERADLLLLRCAMSSTVQ